MTDASAVRIPLGVLALRGLSALGPLPLDLHLPALPALTADLLSLARCLTGLALGRLFVGPLGPLKGSAARTAAEGA